MPKIILYTIISIIGTGLIMFLYVWFFLHNPETKIKIDQHEISTKLNVNETIHIPTKYKISVVYLFDDGFTSPHVEVNLSNKIYISIFSSDNIETKDGKFVGVKILNNIKIREYQTEDKGIIYLFKVGQLNYLYEFEVTDRMSIDRYLFNK